MSRKIIRLMSVLIVFLSISWQLYNYSMYGHYHKSIKLGYIYHYHPFSNSSDSKLPLKDHTHTDFQLIMLDNISNQNYIQQNLFSLETNLFFLEFDNFIPEKTKSFSRQVIRDNRLRAPPVV